MPCLPSLNALHVPLRKQAFLPTGLLIGMWPADMGDAAKSLACLLEEEPLDSKMQEELLQSMHFAASRAFLLLRMTANALLVHMGQPKLLGCGQSVSSLVHYKGWSACRH